LFFIQELEPETYGRLTRRLAGIDMAGKMGVKDSVGFLDNHQWNDNALSYRLPNHSLI